MSNQEKTNTKEIIKRTVMFLSIMICTAASAGFISFFLFLNPHKSNELKKEEKIDFENKFVIYKKGKDKSSNIRLDIENGCLYIENNGFIDSPLVKDNQFDCDSKYIEEYRMKHDKKGEKR